MHRFLRNLHLVLGLTSILFILTYAVSAVQMAHRIRLAPQISDEDMKLPAGLEARPLAEMLMEKQGYGGELGKPQAMTNGFRVVINRPGTSFTVTYDATTGQSHIRRETRSMLGMLNRLHHQHGLHHLDGRLNAWGWALAMISGALFFIGGTGVYLWYRMHTERVVGSVLLTANLLVSVGLLMALRW
jgi:hypothetical protein